MSAGRTLRVFTYSGNPNGHMLAPSRGYLCMDYGISSSLPTPAPSTPADYDSALSVLQAAAVAT